MTNTKQTENAPTKVQVFFSKLPSFFNMLVLFGGIMGSLALFFMGGLILYRVYLSNDVVKDISGPVSRFVANVDFSSKKVTFDTTFSKTQDADPKITIWRFGDGKVIKSSDANSISENEVMEYTFKEPGTYTIGYSIIDKNDLSDEATCTISFATTDKSNTVLPKVNSVSDDCGKSYTSYNDLGSEYYINNTRAEIRYAYWIFGIGAALLLGSLIFNKVFGAFFEKKIAS